MAYNKYPIEVKLLNKARREGDCLIWRGDKDPYGYGRIRYAGKKGYPAHRLVYELEFGTIPEGLMVRHKCDNPSCINIDHLEIGTQKQNVADMYERGRENRPKGELHGRSKLTQTQVDEIRSIYVPFKRGSGMHSLASKFDVSQSTIRSIIRGEYWKTT